jgi:hypothetical protein
MNTSSLASYAFWIGLILVAATHVYMLALGLPASQMMAHAILNLVAAALMAFGWTKHSH